MVAVLNVLGEFRERLGSITGGGGRWDEHVMYIESKFLAEQKTVLASLVVLVETRKQIYTDQFFFQDWVQTWEIRVVNIFFLTNLN